MESLYEESSWKLVNNVMLVWVCDSWYI